MRAESIQEVLAVLIGVAGQNLLFGVKGKTLIKLGLHRAVETTGAWASTPPLPNRRPRVVRIQLSPGEGSFRGRVGQAHVWAEQNNRFKLNQRLLK